MYLTWLRFEAIPGNPISISKRCFSCSDMFYYPFLVFTFLEDLKCALICPIYNFDQSERTSTLLKKVNTKKAVHTTKKG